MKKKFFISLSIIAISVIAFLSLFRRGETAKLDLLDRASSTNASVVENTLQPSANTQQAITNVSASALPEQGALQTVDSVALEEKARAMIEANNIPVDFY